MFLAFHRGSRFAATYLSETARRLETKERERERGEESLGAARAIDVAKHFRKSQRHDRDISRDLRKIS